MKGGSEQVMREALTRMGEDYFLHAYKVPDDARNPKPCDYLVWEKTNYGGPPGIVRSYWVEVKQTRAKNIWNARAELTPSQKQGIETCLLLGIPYWVCVWWVARKKWTLTPGQNILGAIRNGVGSLSYANLSSVDGVDCDTAHLRWTLHAAFDGELA